MESFVFHGYADETKKLNDKIDKVLEEHKYKDMKMHTCYSGGVIFYLCILIVEEKWVKIIMTWKYRAETTAI